MLAISKLGINGLTEMATMLQPAGKGDNTSLQFALAGYAKFVSAALRDTLRGRAIKAWSKALPMTTDANNKIFLIELLQIFGDNKAVPLLKPYLLNSRFSDPAIRALVQIKSPAAVTAMEIALDKAKGASEISLVKALGQLRHLGAEPGIMLRAKSDDPVLKRAALFALANIASEDSEPLLAAAAEKVNFGNDITGATAAYLLFASNLANNWPTAPAVTAANNVLRKCKEDSVAHIRIAALKIIVDVMGENATRTLITAADDKNREYRGAALAMAARNINAVSASMWTDKAATTEGELKATIITMLAESKQRIAISLFTKALKDSSQLVRLAAINAAAQVQSMEMLSPLLVAIKTADTAELKAIGNALLHIRSRDVSGSVAVAMLHVPPAAQLILLDVLVSKKAVDKEQFISRLLASEDATVISAARAALKAIRE
ncbi:HEAT repeat domain-containing protein [Chitinophaga rhizophila]|uniref:HEAT repeat protein n=1 Tax=Chitinophaga rhizophila TaxID=2866212 RepID=A0ABS7G9D0_9BACT|nr:HEAT repeat domain-containing protein [Chitinophaga rhizophila]MBW8683735.1 hypothetical protein [Chitinophaga rhizophila]